jgi:hypothetical protein
LRLSWQDGECRSEDADGEKYRAKTHRSITYDSGR